MSFVYGFEKLSCKPPKSKIFIKGEDWSGKLDFESTPQ